MTSSDYSFELIDPRPTAVASPYTFFIPSEKQIAAVEVGDCVQLNFKSIPNDRKHESERRWVDITGRENSRLVGELANKPFDMPQLSLGDQIIFERYHIMTIQWGSEVRSNRFREPNKREYWERCMVDKEVVDGVARVGFLYREAPDMTQDGDKYPDSGWRIRADVSQLNDEQYENPEPKYIALGAVLNADDSWLHLIDSPERSRFLLNQETGEFEKTEEE